MSVLKTRNDIFTHVNVISIFCQSHLNPHSHNCTYDYKSEKKRISKK